MRPPRPRRKGIHYRKYTAEEKSQAMAKVEEGMFRKDISDLLNIPKGTIDHWIHQAKQETLTKVLDLTPTPLNYPRPDINRSTTEASFVSAFVDRVNEWHYQVQHFREVTMQLTQEKAQAIEERDSAREENKKLLMKLNNVVFGQANWKDQIAAVGKSLNDA
jgi:transposase-like protein